MQVTEFSSVSGPLFLGVVGVLLVVIIVMAIILSVVIFSSLKSKCGQKCPCTSGEQLSNDHTNNGLCYV